MRRLGCLLLGATIGLSAPAAHAQPADAPRTFMNGAQPPADPPYEPSAHGGIPEGAWIRMTRGTGRRSTAMMATGIAVVGLGAIAMGLGTALYEVKPSCSDSAAPSGIAFAGVAGCSSVGARATGMAMLVAGTIAVALGVPLWVVGASDVPWAEAATLHAAPPRVWAAPTLVGAPGGAGLVWRF